MLVHVFFGLNVPTYFHTYRGWLVFVMEGSSTHLYSKEGMTQGNPSSMFMYAIGTLSLIGSLNDPGQ